MTGEETSHTDKKVPGITLIFKKGGGGGNVEGIKTEFNCLASVRVRVHRGGGKTNEQYSVDSVLLLFSVLILVWKHNRMTKVNTL